MIQTTRVESLNDDGLRRGDYVLYWMQQSQRAESNHALEYAVREANRLKQPMVVGFGLTSDYPEANLRHYTFMLEGLQETSESLAERGIRLCLRLGSPDEVALHLAGSASMVVCDRGYLRHQKRWRRRVARRAGCRVVQVESDVVVPVGEVSAKAEYAARTLRPKLHRLLDEYLVECKPRRLETPSLRLKLAGDVDAGDGPKILKALRLKAGPHPVSPLFRGGTSQARRRLKNFIQKRLKNYARHSNQPQTDDISGMSPYLHFGQISPLELALGIKQTRFGTRKAKEAYLEELLVRRELAVNFVNYTSNYDEFGCVPAWAQKSLRAHQKDRREHRYDRQALEDSRTHDPYWNAAMREMKATGFMHNYMRMYWGKKILEWTPDPAEAFETTLAINNKYFIDGRDPNSYAGVAWIYGVHDRAWPERPIFGKVRYMAASGLERKCDIEAYVKKVNALVERMQERD
jgi:deoxyribodipyrimidine photo-lyase